MKKFVVVVCAMCLLMSMVAVAADKAAAKTGKWSGWVSDEKCATGDKASNAECAKKCIEGGAKAVFVTEKDKKVIAINNPEAVKGHEGHHVSVTGSITDNQLHVDSVKMLAAKGEKAEHKM